MVDDKKTFVAVHENSVLNYCDGEMRLFNSIIDAAKWCEENEPRAMIMPLDHAARYVNHTSLRACTLTEMITVLKAGHELAREDVDTIVSRLEELIALRKFRNACDDARQHLPN